MRVEPEESGFILVKLSEHPELLERAVRWFAAKWRSPEGIYRESIEGSMHAVVPSWYLCMRGGEIAAGAGVSWSDENKQAGLPPNVCALYTDEAHRGRGLAGRLLNHICQDMLDHGFPMLYLVTNHTSFYERYGWKFLGMVDCEGEAAQVRVYLHRYAEKAARQ